MEVDWDRAKAIFNLKKHGVDFADAATVLYDNLAVSMSDESSGEERLVTLGMDALGRTLVVVYTWRRDRVVRIISARKATPAERRHYES